MSLLRTVVGRYATHYLIMIAPAFYGLITIGLLRLPMPLRQIALGGVLLMVRLSFHTTQLKDHNAVATRRHYMKQMNITNTTINQVRTLFVCLIALVVVAISSTTADASQYDNRDRAVKVTADIQVDPPQITLRWESEWNQNYRVYRKQVDANEWGTPVYSGSETAFVDTAVAIGERYEYKIDNGYQGYIVVGLDAPMIDYRGKLLLIVDETFSESLSAEIDRLKDDLTGDGWQVIYHTVQRTDTPVAVKTLIQTAYVEDPENVKTVFLLGHVPVPYSGNHGNDGHGGRAWPADIYYGDMDGVWTDSTVNIPSAINRNVPNDGVFDQSAIVYSSSHRPELAVGRVDLSNMPEFAPLEEEDLLRQYLDKDHAYRHAIWTLPQRGIVWDNLGAGRNYPYPGVVGWQNYVPMFGQSDVDLTNAMSSIASLPGYLWVHANSTAGYTGLHGGYSTAAFKTDDPSAAFYEMFGSYFGDWDTTNNLLRAPLATTTYGLASVWSNWGRWQFHHMGSGATIGESVQRTLGNNRLYRNIAIFPEMNLMGDPTLRLHTVKPISNLTSTQTAPWAVRLAWAASDVIDQSTQQPLGYHIYRRAENADWFERLTTSPITEAAYLDTNLAEGGVYTYMVRAVVLQQSPSGSYVNPSQGIMTAQTVFDVPVPPIEIRAISNCGPNQDQFGLQLTLENTFANGLYEVQYSTNLQDWLIAETNIAGEDVETVWADCGGPGRDLTVLQRVFYRATIAGDLDGDGLGTGYELTILDTDPFKADTDGVAPPDGGEDFDDDGLTNLEEYRAAPGGGQRSVNNATCLHGHPNPFDADSDDDGVLDGQDAFPLDPAASLDLDCDGLANQPLNGTSRSLPPVEEDAQFDLTIAVAGNGSVEGNLSLGIGDDIVCSDNCTVRYYDGSVVDLQAIVGEGSFIGWSSATCADAASTSCSFTLTADTTVTAIFAVSAPVYPWQTIADGTQINNMPWDYALGYHFTPRTNGLVTQLGGNFTGTKTVRLFKFATGELLAETSVTCANGWCYSDIDPVAVEAGVRYTVAVYLAGSGGTYRYGINYLPRTSESIRIEGTTWAYTRNNPEARPTNTYPYYMLGQADIQFAETEAPNTTIEQPWRDNENGRVRMGYRWDYALGYHFTPQVDGYVTELCGFFNGSKMVRLFNKTTGAKLAETAVSSANSWQCTAIDPVTVSADETYTVAGYLAGSGGAYRYGIQHFPKQYGDIRIEATTFAYTGSNAEARPINSLTTYMFGQVDITFASAITRDALAKDKGSSVAPTWAEASLMDNLKLEQELVNQFDPLAEPTAVTLADLQQVQYRDFAIAIFIILSLASLLIAHMHRRKQT